MSLECAYCERDLRGGHAPDCDRPPLLKAMNPTPLEKDIERKIGEYAKKQGVEYRKLTSPANRAVPDRLLLAQGGIVGFLEIKRKGQKPTPLQWRELRKLKDLGMNVGWCDSVEAGEQFVRLLLKDWGNKPVVMGEGLV